SKTTSTISPHSLHAAHERAAPVHGPAPPELPLPVAPPPPSVSSTWTVLIPRIRSHPIAPCAAAASDSSRDQRNARRAPRTIRRPPSQGPTRHREGPQAGALSARDSAWSAALCTTSRRLPRSQRSP